jgi:hypothetical protein
MEDAEAKEKGKGGGSGGRREREQARLAGCQRVLLPTGVATDSGAMELSKRAGARL